MAEKAWLLARSGPAAGTRFPLPEGTTRVGRAPDNDAVVAGPDAVTVSGYHLEIHRDAKGCRVHDLESTNGTWLNGERVTEAEVSFPAVIQLGNQGPEFALLLEETQEELDRTLEISAAAAAEIASAAAAPPAAVAPHEGLLEEAVARARRARAHGMPGQTMTIMRGVIEEALKNTRRRFRIVGYSLTVALVAVTGLGAWKIVTMKWEKAAIDGHIQQLERELEKAQGPEADQLVSQLDNYQNEAESLQHTLLYRIGGGRQRGDFVTMELHALMAEFGAEVYSIPPDFVDRVNHYVQQDEGADRPLIEWALGADRGEIQTIRAMLQQHELPVDLAYIPIVESALEKAPESPAGAVGPWQLTAATARAYGLKVDGRVDERKNLVKSTQASMKYLRDLILDFGTGSSVMLALAAYNSGPTKVKQAVNRVVQDPIKQRNFWYLYRTQALPEETREFVPKVFAAMLIGRDPKHFGF